LFLAVCQEHPLLQEKSTPGIATPERLADFARLHPDIGSRLSVRITPCLTPPGTTWSSLTWSIPSPPWARRPANSRLITPGTASLLTSLSPLVRGDNVLHLAPTALTLEIPTTLYLRVTRPMRQAEVKIGRVLSRKQMGVRPSEMIEIKISDDELKELAQYSEILVEVTGT